jgi:hypothetical protein
MLPTGLLSCPAERLRRAASVAVCCEPCTCWCCCCCCCFVSLLVALALQVVAGRCKRCWCARCAGLRAAAASAMMPRYLCRACQAQEHCWHTRTQGGLQDSCCARCQRPAHRASSHLCALWASAAVALCRSQSATSAAKCGFAKQLCGAACAPPATAFGRMMLRVRGLNAARYVLLLTAVVSLMQGTARWKGRLVAWWCAVWRSSVLRPATASTCTPRGHRCELLLLRRLLWCMLMHESTVYSSPTPYCPLRASWRRAGGRRLQHTHTRTE